MASRDELRNMVMQFKVSDLQLLLGFAGQNKNGRKPELKKKAVNLIFNKMSLPLEMKIRQLYREMIAENNASLPNSYAFQDNYSYPCYDNGYTSRAMPSNNYDSYNTNNYNNNTSDSRNFFDWKQNGNVRPIYNSQSQNNTNSQPSEFSRVDEMKNVPDRQKLNNVVFKKLSFYKYKSEILPVTPMLPKVKLSDSFEYTVTFTLSSHQQSLISWARKNDKESLYQIQLRMCELDDSLNLTNKCVVSDSLPLALGVKVNEKSSQLPPAIPSTNKQGMLLKRMNAPINLTPQSRKNHVNNLVVHWSIETNKLFGIAVHFVEKFTADDLIDKLRKNGERDPAITKKYVSDKLDELGDDDIAATSLKVSLICPLGKILMTLPTRATTCNHLQCFDCALYIKMNEVKSTWQCPVCNQSCFYEDLFIDGFFTNVLKSETFNPSVTEIQIEADGSITPVIPKKRGKNTEECSPRKKRRTDTEEIRTNDAKGDVSQSKDETVSCENHSEEPRKKVSKTDCSKNPKELPKSPDNVAKPIDCDEISEGNSKKSGNLTNIETKSKNSDKSITGVDQPNESAPSTSKKANESSFLPSFVPLFSSYDGYSTWNGESSVDSMIPEKLTHNKNVVLVDLTESDDESEDVECANVPLNLKITKEEPAASESHSKKSPPVYDIDDSDPS